MSADHSLPLNRRRLLLASALSAASTLAGCLADDDGDPATGDDDGSDENGGNGGENDGNGTIDMDGPIGELTRENRRFAFELYEQLVSADPDENLFYSPHSISIALAMTIAGARGETADQMAETLHYTLGEDIHQAIEDLAAELDRRSELESDGEDQGDPFELTVENTVWGQADYPFHDEYLELLENHYGAGLREVDFQSDPEGARETINEWVEDQTNEKIEELLPEGSITELARLVLTNAVYFQAAWETKFDESTTEQRAFTALDGTVTDVPMMRQSDSFPYAEVDGHQLIELPYVGGDVGMVVILPAEGEFDSFEADLDRNRFDDLTGELESREGSIQFPRFEFDAGFSLKEILSEMGMPVAFDDHEADFSGIADLKATGENLFIHDVYHDAAITVDEEGTEAAAATGVVIGTESAPMDPFEMVVDRPFLFAIRDRPTGALVFFGRVVDAGRAQ